MVPSVVGWGQRGCMVPSVVGWGTEGMYGT